MSESNNTAPIVANLLSIGQVAEVLKVSQKTTEQIIKTMNMPVIHLGGTRRVWADDLIAFLRSNTKTASELFQGQTEAE